MKTPRFLAAMALAMSSLFFAMPASATQITLEEAQAALVLAQQEVSSASAALQSASEAVATADVARSTSQAVYNEALAAWEATRVVHPATTSTSTQNVVQNGTFDGPAGWSGVVASTTQYTNGASPISINGILKGSYTAGIYIQQTGTFPSPTRQVTFAVDVWNYDTNEGNRINNPDYYRIEFRTYNAAGQRLNYYNLEWSQWHDSWITRGATYTLSDDAVRWDIGFRMQDSGYWAGAFGPSMDNVRLIATMGTTTPETYTYGEPETATKVAAYDAMVAANASYSAAVSAQASAQTRYDAAVAEVQRLIDLIVQLTPHLNAPTNLTYTLNPDSITLNWDAPVSNLSGISVERYAIMWSTTNFESNGWGWAHDQTSVTIPISILAEHGGLGNTFSFRIRADNDTQSVYSPYSNTASVVTVAPPEPAWWQIQFWEGETASIGAPEGYKFGQPRAWYGSPTDPNCGADVSSIVNEIINGRTTATFSADNGLFGDPCGGVVKVLRMSTPVDVVVVAPTPTVPPTPTPLPEPTPEPIQPQPVEPSPTVSPEPEPTPEPVDPTPTPSPEPEPSPTTTPEPAPTPLPTQEPTKQPTSEPTPSPSKVPESIVPESKPAEKPAVEIKEEITAENIEAFVKELSTVQPQLLTEQQQALITEAAMQTFETAEQGSPAYEAALDALLVVAKADDIVLNEELAAIPLIGNVAGAAVEVFNALGNAGADMSPQVREQSEKVVIAAVIVGQVAMTATAAATSAAAAAARRP